MNNLTISGPGLNMIKHFEGCEEKVGKDKFRAYLCPAGKWTIGYGHTDGVQRGMTIDKETAEELLREDCDAVADTIRRLVKVPLSQSQFDAVSSFIFNLGEGNFKRSTLLKKLNKGDIDGAAGEFHRWNKARDPQTKKLSALPGLTRRRAAEAALFTADTRLPRQGGDKMPQEVTAEGAKKPLTRSRTMAGAALAAAGTAASATSTYAHELSQTFSSLATQVHPMLGKIPHLEYVFLGATVAGIALSAYARWDDQRKASV